MNSLETWLQHSMGTTRFGSVFVEIPLASFRDGTMANP